MAELSFVSRGGLKLAAALAAFGIDPTGMICADLGCNVGGFTDCLLQQGARQVYAVDTGYGSLAWKLRQDPRVTVMERTNAVHANPWEMQDFAGCELVVIDLGWTRQVHALPAALRWLKPAVSHPTQTAETLHPPGRIITLIKPHYEADRNALPQHQRGVLMPDQSESILHQTLTTLPASVRVLQHIVSPIVGGAGKGRKGNIEYLALLEPA